MRSLDMLYIVVGKLAASGFESDGGGALHFISNTYEEQRIGPTVQGPNPNGVPRIAFALPGEHRHETDDGLVELAEQVRGPVPSKLTVAGDLGCALAVVGEHVL